MKIEIKTDLDALRELIAFPDFGLPDYSIDISVQRRLGGLLADASLQLASNKSVVIRGCSSV
jgi:hypothetical protein